MFTRITASPAETIELASLVGQRVREGTVICLQGDLGAGKTLFAQSLARTLGAEGEITSPTFSLMNIYEGICPIVHFDLYRLETEEELADIGFYEYVEIPEGIVLIEWAEKFPEALPEDYLIVFLEGIEGHPEERMITFAVEGEKHLELLKELEEIC